MNTAFMSKFWLPGQYLPKGAGWQFCLHK